VSDSPHLLVRSEHLQKWYGRNQVLVDVNLGVPEGQVMCIIGPSGSGKSTFLRCINQLESYQGGRLWLGDELIAYREGPKGELVPLKQADIVKQRRRVGMVFQQFNLFWHKTVLENLIEAPVLVLGKSVEESTEAALQLLERVGLKDKADVYPSRLSGGQQQRAAIARSLAMKPEVLLFDEPTSSLDPETTGEVLNVMSELAETGMTMVVVTHEMSFARKVADRVVMMENGIVQYEAGPDEFFEDQANARLRAFLSSME
jgi:polar amino acid transport system ATP-binding protein